MRTSYCAYTDCRKKMPAVYGKAGVSRSRYDHVTLICSGCGVLEAFGGKDPNKLKPFVEPIAIGRRNLAKRR